MQSKNRITGFGSIAFRVARAVVLIFIFTHHILSFSNPSTIISASGVFGIYESDTAKYSFSPKRFLEAFHFPNVVFLIIGLQELMRFIQEIHIVCWIFQLL